MTRIDQIIADALAGSPETHVAILAREVARLREAPAVVVPPLPKPTGRRADDAPVWGMPEDLEDVCRQAGNPVLAAYQVGIRRGHAIAENSVRAIPADRVLGEGMVAVSREEFEGATRWTFDGIDIHKVEHKKGFWFAVRRGNSCMSRSGEWDLEPLPSSRTPEFFAEFRFDTFRDALTALRANQGGQ